MANYKLVNADQLDSDLTAVGNAIRSKSGTSAKLSFPSGMVSAIGAISTGVELNFDVVPGLTQPGTAAENTIWVKTEKLGAWYFSATQPEGMQEWDVWFSAGTSSNVEFNALKKNGIQVYPLSAKQMISGALVKVEAMSYKDGEWIAWITYVFRENGEDAEKFTGNHGVNGAFTISDSKIVVSQYSTIDSNVANVFTVDTYYFHGNQTLVFDAVCTTQHNDPTSVWARRVGIYSGKNGPTEASTVNLVAGVLMEADSTRKLYRIPIESDGEYYIATCGCGNAKICNIYIE